MNWFEQIKRLSVKLPELGIFRTRSAEIFLVLFLLVAVLIYWFWPPRAPGELLNVAFDAGQTLYLDVDSAWKKQSGVSVYSLHAGSIRQTQTLTTVLVADTICASSPWELDALTRNAIVAEDWPEHFPNDASPFHSYVVFLARKGAERHVRNWSDLFGADLRYALPSPDVSGGGRHAYLALAHYANKHFGTGSWIYSDSLDRAVFLPYGARRCTEIFLMDPSLDLLLTWESEALRILDEQDASQFSIIKPEDLIRIDVVVAVAIPQTNRRNTHLEAWNYLKYLFSPEARQHILDADFHPTTPEDRYHDADALRSISIPSLFGSWQAAIDQHLGESGSYQRLLAYRKARTGGSE